VNTELAAKVMELCAQKVRRPDWVLLGKAIAAEIDRHPHDSAESIADEVIENWASNR